MNWVAFVVPAFFLFVGIEYWMSLKKRKEKLFNYENSVSNISVGIAERILNLLIAGSFYNLYQYIYDHFALFPIPNRWYVWVLLLFATDFVWYWYHRLGHEINIFWGAHIVHHQSEDFNYTVSARITTLQAIVRNMFWCSLPWVGFEPSMVLTILIIHGTYSFFTHTQVIGKLGWLEYFLVTPTHHGVHHASNEKYLDKNYGDIFIIWDKLFGTFQNEEEKPVYGLTHPLKSHSFLWQHFHYYAELWEACKRSKSFFKSMKIIFGKPDILDPLIRPTLEAKFLFPKKHLHLTFRFKVYLNLQLIASIIGAFVLILLYNQLSAFEITFIISLIIITLINCGALLERQRWVYHLELVRAILIAAYLSYYNEDIALFATSVIILVLIGSFSSVEKFYFRFIYGASPVFD